MLALETEQQVRIEGGTDSRRSHDVAVIVDSQSNSVRVSVFGGKLDREAVRPSHSFEMKFLRSRESKIVLGSFSPTDREAPIVVAIDSTVIASEGGKCIRLSALPEGWQTNKVRTKSAKVLSVGV